jgi:hypothetical protein
MARAAVVATVGAMSLLVTMAAPASANMVGPPRGLQMNPTGKNLLGASQWINNGDNCDPRRSTMDLTTYTGGGSGNTVKVNQVTVHWRGDRPGRYGVLYVHSGDGKKVRTIRTNGNIGGPINTPDTTVTYKVNDTFAYPVQFEVGESLQRYQPETSGCTNNNSLIAFQGLKPPPHPA